MASESLGHSLQALYESEINFSISCFWDGGFDWKLGDEMNGYRAEGNERSFGVAVARLVQAVFEHFPKSKFARDRMDAPAS